MRKEYNDRWNAPLVNPGFTEAEYQERKAREAKGAPDMTPLYDAAEKLKASFKPKSILIPTIDGRESEAS
jgi:hypothetical protein